MDHNDLDIDMAHLNINEKKRISTGRFKYKLKADQSSNSSPELEENSTHPRRSGRKKIRCLESEKRRVLMKPRKLLDIASTNQINNYYLDKRVKRLPPSLETIFEEPKGDNFMSNRKFKRCIQFSSQLGAGKDKLKVKRRVMKAKKVCIIKRLNKKVAMDLLQEKLSAIEDDENVLSDSATPE